MRADPDLHHAPPLAPDPPLVSTTTSGTLVQLVCRCRFNRAPFFDEDQARWLWERLRANFPDAIAVCLMPNHVHIVLRTLDVEAARRKLAAVLAAFTRAFGHHRLWLPVEPASAYEGVEKVRRVIRYVALNPCRPFKLGLRRVRLVGDPLEWPWSTHRDVVGAVVDPWVEPGRLAVAVRSQGTDFLGRWQSYVASDDRVGPGGELLPVPVTPTVVPVVPLAIVLSAVAISMRMSLAVALRRPIGRRLAVALAAEQGWTDAKLMGEALGLSPKQVRKLQGGPPPAGLSAARLCLGDRRLREPKLLVTFERPWVDSSRSPRFKRPRRS